YDVHGEIMDQPAAALFKDMKQRGLLDDTLIVWCTEFGRMPMFQKGAKGRDHNQQGFTAWLGGAGVKLMIVAAGTADCQAQKSRTCANNDLIEGVLSSEPFGGVIFANLTGE
ncbi:DUF1501 domain-containing protein, partial [Planctomycetaceae bacterium]|nr:DUF1501 domain-containing protein [Planctomycetaceae bacterium]